ncbi:ribonuclease H protein [Trifolium medium]|uniref:Ribonuclease H protein n=1 Tax=Trifolium medium TaxID=97028 RepID=A0A392M6S1_9FABA|nr:ribonuclease H protein [Trifolium medium]
MMLLTQVQATSLSYIDGRAGCGGAIRFRGSEGEWIGGFAKFVGHSIAFVAELWGVYEGLKFVRKLGLRAVKINVDSLSVVKVLEGNHGGSTLARVP